MLMELKSSAIRSVVERARPEQWLSLFLVSAVVALSSGCFEKKPSTPQDDAPLVDPNDVLDVQEQAPVIDPEIPEFTINKDAQVSILGYHDFITGRSKNPMKINIDKFREQMQALKDAGIPVIGFDEFLAWKRGETDINDPSVMITIDDGWRSTYELAWPVLKEFGYPFSVYLYTDYVGGGGRALTIEMIKEMIAGGVEIGSHTVSHPLRKSVFASQGSRTKDEYAAYLQNELEESKKILESKFGINVRLFAYPGGIYSDEIAVLCEKYGYAASITCNPSRTTWDTPMQKLHRYVVHGNNDLNFRTAMSFRQFSGENTKVVAAVGVDHQPEDAGDEVREGRVIVRPAPDSVIAERRPIIAADLSQIEGAIDPMSVVLKLSGLGHSPAIYDPETRMITFQPVMPIRRRNTEVVVHYKREGERKREAVGWQFEIDLHAVYLPAEAEASGAAAGAAE